MRQNNGRSASTEGPVALKEIAGLPIHCHPSVPSHLPKVTFDPKRNCAWASEEYRALMNAWLLQRFGTEAVAFIIDTRYLFGGAGRREAFVGPAHAALFRGFADG